MRIEIPESQWNDTFSALEERYQQDGINIYVFHVVDSDDDVMHIEWDREEGFPDRSPNSLRLVPISSGGGREEEDIKSVRMVEILKVVAEA